MKYLTLFTSGVAETGKNTILYKDITEFHKNNDGTITFKTQKGVEVESCLPWRVNTGTKEQLEALAGAGDHVEGAAPRAGRQGAPRY